MKSRLLIVLSLLLVSCVHPQSSTLAGAAATVTDPATLVYRACDTGGSEFTTCAFKGTKYVRFGTSPSSYNYKTYTDGVSCDFRTLGDPAPGKTKACTIADVPTTPVPVPDAGVPPVVDAGTCNCPCPSVDAGVPPVVDSGVKPDSGTPPVVDSGVPPAGGAANRPAASKGVGFFTLGGKLYDGNGKEFRMRGTNKTHQDFQAPGLGKTKSNATRWLVYFTEQPERTIQDMQSPNIGGTTAHKAVQIPGYWDGTCKSDSGTFNTMVNRWVRDAAKYQTFEKYMILNIANEWGDNPVAWKDAYVAAIPKIRAAGWHGTIMVDAPGCGQNATAILQHGAAVLAADPEKNVMFSWHVYGFVYDSQGGIPKQWNEQVDLVPTMQALKASGLTAIVGEFGPGRNVGPSPTLLTPQRVMDVAEANQIGYLSWSWDDNNLSGGMSNEDSFSHSVNGNYNSPSDLLTFGKIMVDYWNRLATPASIFP